MFHGAFFFILYSPCTEKVVFYLLTCCLNCPVQCIQPPSLPHCDYLSVYIVKGHVLLFHSPRSVVSRAMGYNCPFSVERKRTNVTVEYFQHLIKINIETKTNTTVVNKLDKMSFWRLLKMYCG